MEKYRSSTQLLIKTKETVDYAGREGIGITYVITKSNVCHSRLKKLMSKIVSTGLVTEIKSDGRHVGRACHQSFWYCPLLFLHSAR